MKINVPTRRKALSQVVTTLIILVISILMTSGTLISYSTAVASSSLKMEQLVIREARVWVNETGAQSAVQVENIGGRDALITTVEVRYIEEEWSSIYYAHGECTPLTPVQGMNITGPFSHTVADATLNFTQATGSILLPVGGSIVIYIDQPDSLDITDLGTIVYINVYTSTLQYIDVIDVELA